MLFIFIAFLSPAATYVRLDALAEMLKLLAVWLPHLLAAIIIVLIGLIVADFAAEIIVKAKKIKGIRIISKTVKALIIIYTVAIALDQIGIQVQLAEYSWYIILGGIMLAFAISFGLAFKKQAEKLVGDFTKKL